MKLKVIFIFLYLFFSLNSTFCQAQASIQSDSFDVQQWKCLVDLLCEARSFRGDNAVQKLKKYVLRGNIDLFVDYLRAKIQEKYSFLYEKAFRFWGERLGLKYDQREQIVQIILHECEIQDSGASRALFLFTMMRVFFNYEKNKEDFNVENDKLGKFLCEQVFLKFSDIAKEAKIVSDLEKPVSEKRFMKKRYLAALLLFFITIGIGVKIFFKLRGKSGNQKPATVPQSETEQQPVTEQQPETEQQSETEQQAQTVPQSETEQQSETVARELQRLRQEVSHLKKEYRLQQQKHSSVEKPVKRKGFWECLGEIIKEDVERVKKIAAVVGPVAGAAFSVYQCSTAFDGNLLGGGNDLSDEVSFDFSAGPHVEVHTPESFFHAYAK